MPENQNNLLVISIVAIVAVVGIVALVMQMTNKEMPLIDGQKPQVYLAFVNEEGKLTLMDEQGIVGIMDSQGNLLDENGNAAGAALGPRARGGAFLSCFNTHTGAGYSEYKAFNTCLQLLT